MNKELYPMIFKRKSYHTFKDNKTGKYYKEDYHISDEEYEMIQDYFRNIVPLYPDIRVEMRIADNEETTCKRGQEKVILLYSEKKDNYLMNIGYIGEQLDLYLASLNIGTLWFGLNKAEMDDYDSLKYVIMIAIGKVPESSFRKDMYKAKRKELSEIYTGKDIKGIGNIVRFAPSACNTQPWKIINKNNVLEVYRYRSPIRKWVMPVDGVVHYNHIDIGIFMCFIELCFLHENIGFDRKLYVDDKNEEMNLVCEYSFL